MSSETLQLYTDKYELIDWFEDVSLSYLDNSFLHRYNYHVQIEAVDGGLLYKAVPNLADSEDYLHGAGLLYSHLRDNCQAEEARQLVVDWLERECPEYWDIFLERTK